MQVVQTKIRLIAQTAINFDMLRELEPDWAESAAVEENRDIDGQLLIEFAGRECYQSWSKPNPATASNSGYIENLLKQRHFSVFEHASATFRFENVSRSFTHELIRHRHFSYSQLSQRYVDASDVKIVLHPDVEDVINAERGDGDNQAVN